MTACRLVTPDDAPALAQLLRLNRDFLAPWEPVRGSDYFTAAGQSIVIQDALCQHEQGRNLPLVIVDEGRASSGGSR
jgi:[ribosomal protein S5]-alanine N-acetyltransferase